MVDGRFIMQWNLCKISADTQICTFGELDCSATFALSAILCDDLFCFEVAAGSSIEFRKCRSVVVGMLIRIRAWCSCQTFPSAIITPLHHSWAPALIELNMAHTQAYGPKHWFMVHIMHITADMGHSTGPHHRHRGQ